MDEKELMKLSAGELTDLGICPTCFNRKHNGAVFGDNSDKLIYEDHEIECFLWEIQEQMGICAFQLLSIITI